MAILSRAISTQKFWNFLKVFQWSLGRNDAKGKSFKMKSFLRVSNCSTFKIESSKDNLAIQQGTKTCFFNWVPAVSWLEK